MTAPASRTGASRFRLPTVFAIPPALYFFEDGRLADIFLNVGTAIETAARDSAVVASLGLQCGVCG